ncbi:GNAT family N-acetyltransferase [Massilia sp. CFBP9012]|uniref:GNAT family N-acetyltransferase n=1 Tax=Massilia sp. CFBP9012 TaxID=3096531 RepID=UPI002A6A619B|nr:GNAT family N-acetyltransferase [Massilia sp. CFBP9012]MDY0976664.1 GNAT family N-acetyltransferase [Massilia sp. CFBP9012]
MQDDPPDRAGLPALARLRDGRTVLLREIQAQDEDEMREAFHRLSADSRYARFMMPLREPPPAMLAAATRPDPRHDLALVAVSGEGGPDQDIVAGARYVGAAGSDSCEFAVTVVDDWHGLGLARRLLEILIAHATARGLRRMEGFVLAANTPMRRLARRLGFVDRQCEDDATLRVVSLDLTAGS